MDSENAHWHNEATDPVVEHYVFDEDAPDTFWVYPPNSGGGSVEIIYSRAPSDLTDLSDTIVLNDIYSNVIVDYILYRAYSKDTDYAGNQERAASHYQAFNGSLGIKLKAEQSSSPNMNPQTLRAAQ